MEKAFKEVESENNQTAEEIIAEAFCRAYSCALQIINSHQENQEASSEKLKKLKIEFEKSAGTNCKLPE
ncbi:MAG: hypothetical protein AAGF07_03545 [Patescibacteria group bacterium]